MLVLECRDIKRVILACTAEKRAVYDKYGKEGLKGTFLFCCHVI